LIVGHNITSTAIAALGAVAEAETPMVALAASAPPISPSPTASLPNGR
jgi:branched-chain amino acid transport system substrate-binding protein